MPISEQEPRLLDQVRNEVRTRHYSIRTERTYVQWVRRYVLFHHKRHPLEMGADEVRAVEANSVAYSPETMRPITRRLIGSTRAGV